MFYEVTRLLLSQPSQDLQSLRVRKAEGLATAFALQLLLFMRGLWFLHLPSQLVWVRWKMEGESTVGHVTPSWSPKGIRLLSKVGGPKQLPQVFELNRSTAGRSLYTPLRKLIAILLFKLHYIIYSNVKSCEY